MKVQNKILLFLIVCVFMLAGFTINVANFVNVKSAANVNYNGQFVQDVVDDEFADDKIIIVLKNDVSLSSKDYNTNDFSEINCVFVEDLTESTLKIVRQQIMAEETGDWSALEERIKKNMLINLDNFHRILCLTIGNAGKKNVLNAIELLEK